MLAGKNRHTHALFFVSVLYDRGMDCLFLPTSIDIPLVPSHLKNIVASQLFEEEKLFTRVEHRNVYLISSERMKRLWS